MSSRLWLAAAFVIAFGAEPTHAEASSDVISVTLDQAKVAKLPPGTSTLIIGNPMIADVTMLKTGDSMVITAKSFGETNVIALGPGGSVIEERQIQVLPAKTTVVLQKGSSRVSYACNPDCMPLVNLGDDSDVFKAGTTEVTMRNSLAQGSASPSAEIAGK